MAIFSHSDDHDAPRLTHGVRVLLALNVAMLFLQWTLVRDADVLAVFGFQDGSLQRTVWSAGTYMFVHYSLWHLALNMYVWCSSGRDSNGRRARGLSCSTISGAGWAVRCFTWFSCAPGCSWEHRQRCSA